MFYVLAYLNLKPMWLTKWKESKKQLQKKIVKVEIISIEIFKHNFATRKKYPVHLAIIQFYFFFPATWQHKVILCLVVVVSEIYLDQLSEISLPRQL